MLVDLAQFDFKTWSLLAKELDDPRTRATHLKKGALLDLHYRSLYEKLLPNAELVKFAGHKIYALNCPYYFADDLGHELAIKTQSFSLLWNESGGRIRCSLRSAGKMDVAKIAKKYGGGGHRAVGRILVPGRQKDAVEIVAGGVQQRTRLVIMKKKKFYAYFVPSFGAKAVAPKTGRDRQLGGVRKVRVGEDRRAVQGVR